VDFRYTMEHTFVNYRQSSRKVLKSSDGMLYANAAKSRDHSIQYLRCVLRDCPGSGKLVKEPNQFDHVRLHNHGPQKYMLKQNQLAVTLRQKAASPSHAKETLKEIFKETTRVLDVGAEVSFGYLESGMLKARRKVHPRTPETITELVQVLQDNDMYGKMFKMQVFAGEETALIFAPQSTDFRLPQIKRMNFDGTFFTCPRPFLQLWTILGEFEGKLFPFISVLMTSKSTALYRAALTGIKELFPGLLPTHAMGDFEIAPRTALREAYPNIAIAGCQFHLANNLYKQLGKLQLRGVYASDPLFKKWCRAIMALPFLPARLIASTFEILKQQIVSFLPEVQHKMKTFSTYFKRVYLTKYSAEDISVYRLSRQTNNEQGTCCQIGGKFTIWGENNISVYSEYFCIIMGNF
jgi:hypothetical protein